MKGVLRALYIAVPLTCVAAAASLHAGTTLVGAPGLPSVPVTYAAETAFPAPNNTYVLPGGTGSPAFVSPLAASVVRISTILPNNSIPGASDTVFVEVNLLDGANFGAIASIANNSLAVIGFGACTKSTTAALVSATQIRFRVVFSGFPVSGTCTSSGSFFFLTQPISFPPFFASTNLNVTDTNANLVPPGGSIRVQMRTLDGASVPTDTGGVDTTT